MCSTHTLHTAFLCSSCLLSETFQLVKTLTGKEGWKNSPSPQFTPAPLVTRTETSFWRAWPVRITEGCPMLI